MLTRKEAEKFLNELYDLACDRDNFSVDVVRCVLKSFIEKPKRSMQIGDIYRDKEGFIVEIVQFDVNERGSALSKCGYLYDWETGKYTGEFDRTDLDISKRFELTEVDNG